jgi:hypothetical protein
MSSRSGHDEHSASKAASPSTPRDDVSLDRTYVGRLHDLNIVLNDHLCPACNNEWLAGIERIALILMPMAVHAETTFWPAVAAVRSCPAFDHPDGTFNECLVASNAGDDPQ